MTPMEHLTPHGHTVYQLAAGLLLVFKPRGHHEVVHTHVNGQRLRVLRGRLRVETDGAHVVLDTAAPLLALAPEQPHATLALDDTWVVAETAGAG